MLLAAGQRGVPVALLHAPAGQGRGLRHGRAGKDQVARMVARLLGLVRPPAPDHAADALAVAICDLNRAPLARAVARGPVGAMIALVSGTVAVRRADHVVVDCGGVGYRLAVSAETLRHVPGGRQGRRSCTPTWSSATTRSRCTGSPPRRSASCS